MAAAKGNQYAAKDRRYTAMLQRVLAEPSPSGDRLRNIALKVVEAAEEGQPWAVQEIGNRLDGKPVQPMEHKVEREPQTLSEAFLAYVAQGGKPDEYEAGAETALPN